MAEQMRKATATARDDGWHLVLGGSSGIGFSFAKWLAKRNQRLVIVSRGKDRLDYARAQLLASGATEVRSVAGDLLDQSFRSQIFRHTSTLPLSTIFIGGPSPQAGAMGQVSGLDIESAAKSCIAYPFHVAQLAISPLRPRPLWMVFLSSSTSRDSLANHRFFLSATLRRSAEQILKRIVALAPAGSVSLSIWRPIVVYTHLAKAYARTLPRLDRTDSLRRRLEVHFDCDAILSADEYILHTLKSALSDRPDRGRKA
jgi:hypothetical protein